MKTKKNMGLQASVANLIRELEDYKKEKSFGPSAAQAQKNSKRDYTKEEWEKTARGQCSGFRATGAAGPPWHPRTGSRGPAGAVE